MEKYDITIDDIVKSGLSNPNPDKINKKTKGSKSGRKAFNVLDKEIILEDKEVSEAFQEMMLNYGTEYEAKMKGLESKYHSNKKDNIKKQSSEASEKEKLPLTISKDGVFRMNGEGRASRIETHEVNQANRQFIKRDFHVRAPEVEGNLRIMALGGLGEIGSNMYIYETKNEMLIVDCGASLSNGESRVLGACNDVADFRYVLANKEKVVGIVLTHAHDDHITGMRSLIKYLDTDIYGGKLTLLRLLSVLEGSRYTSPEREKVEDSIYENKSQSKYFGNKMFLIHHGFTKKISNDFEIKFFEVNHSLEDAYGLIIKTKYADIVHTGDFKIEKDPLYGRKTDFNMIKNSLDRKKQIVLVADSTNSMKPGRAFTERQVKEGLEKIFKENKNKNIIISCFATSSHRVKTITELAKKYKKKIIYSGASMRNVMAPIYTRMSDVNIDNDCEKYDSFCMICTGSQGEEGAVLNVISNSLQGNKDISAFQEAISRYISLDWNPLETNNKNTILVMASNPIPGNEKQVNKIISSFELRGFKVITNSKETLTHASGHGYADEVREMIVNIKPDVFVPMHGELIHQLFSEKIAEEEGIKRIIVAKNGEFINIHKNHVRHYQKGIKIEPVIVKKDSYNIMLKDNRLKEVMTITSHDFVYYIIQDRDIHRLHVVSIQVTNSGDTDMSFFMEYEINSAIKDRVLQKGLRDKMLKGELTKTIKKVFGDTILNNTYIEEERLI